MWNNLIFGFLLIATVCTQCKCIGYPKVKPENPLQLPPSDLYDKTNVITGSVIHQSTDTAQDTDDGPEPADDNPDKTFTTPQVTEHPQEDAQHVADEQHVEHGHDHHHQHGADGTYNPHDDGRGWDIRRSVPGEPGRDYPTYDKVVNTSFTCAGKAAGYYADLESRCQIFRVCTTGSINAFNSFLCPNGSLFNQAVLTCDWWPNVDCQGSASHYDKNNGLGNIPKEFIGKLDVRYMLEARLLHPYKPVHEQNNDDTPITSNRISDTKIYTNSPVTPEQGAVTVAEKHYTSKIRYTTPNIPISTFASTPTTGTPIIQSSTGSSSQQYQTGTYDVNETPATDAFVPHEMPANTGGNVLLVSTEQVGDNTIESMTSSHSSFTTETITTGNTGFNQTSDPVFLSTSKTIKLQLKQPLFVTQTSDAADSSSKDGPHVHVSPRLHISPELHVSPVVSTHHNVHSTDKPFLSQNTPVTLDQTNVNKQGPEKITLLTHDDRKQAGLLQEPNVIGTIQTKSGVNIQTGSSVKTNTGDRQVIGALSLSQPGTLNTGVVQSETNKQTFAGISKSVELPGTSEVVSTSGGGLQQHYARILSQGNEQSSTGTQNQPDQTVKQFENQRNQYAGVSNQNIQSGTQHQTLHNQALNNFVVESQNIPGGGITSIPSTFNANTQIAGQNQGVQSDFSLQGQNLQGYNLNQGFTGQIQNAGLQNLQGFQSNFGVGVQNGYTYNHGFTSGLQNHGAYNLGSLNVGSQTPYNQNAFHNQNSFISNQNAGVGGFNPNFHEQNYPNFNFYSQNNGAQNTNYEVSKNGAAQNYKGESLSQHTNGQTHSSYSGHNSAYKESTKVEIVPSLGFTLTEELGRASYASALINGLVQGKRGASSANHAGESISPSDARYSSYQGPSSYLVPQSSVQHLPNVKRESNN